MKKLTLLLVLGLGLSSLSLGAGKLHMLWAIDPNSGSVGGDLTSQCGLNQSKLQEIFGEIFTGERAARYVPRRVAPERFRGSEVMNFYENELKPDAEDTIVFYYCGHGITSDDGKHMLAMSGGYLERGVLRNAMARSKAHLAIIITDTCSSYAGQVGTVPERRVPAEWEGFKDLFFNANGLVDITAARPGEFAWFASDQGGIFSQSLFRLFCESKSDLDTDDNGTVTWKEVFNRAYHDTREAFDKLKERASDGAQIKESTSQSPTWYWLGTQPDWTRAIEVKNDRDEMVCIWLQAYVKFSDGTWGWTKAFSWEIQGGSTARLAIDGTVFKANQIRWWANTQLGGRKYVWGSKESPRSWIIWPFRAEDESDTDYVIRFTY